MRKSTFSVSLLALLAVSGMASAGTPTVNLELVAHNQRSSGSTLSTLIWDGSNLTNSWAIANGVVASDATWTWDGATLTATGIFQTTSHLSSNPNGASVISDKVTDLVINTGTQTTTASAYTCVEGSFLANVGAHGCANVSLGNDFTYNGSVAYNVGGDPNCVTRTVGGDDASTGNPRTLTTTAGGGGCDPGDGAFDMWTIIQDDTATGGQLIIGNDTPITDAGANYLTFQVAVGANDDGPFSVSEAVPTSLDVLANDTGFTDPVTVTVTTPPTKGTATVVGTVPGPQAGITIEYTSNVGATGADTFVYTITGNGGAPVDTATVTINILAFGANNDTVTTTRNHAPIDINVGANDVGFTDPVTIVITVAPDQGGTATPPASGPIAGALINYTPATTAPNTATYTETFTYEVTDADDQTDTAVVTVTVNNTVPVANNTTLTISTTGSAPGSATGSFNASTLAGNSLGNTPSVVTKTDGAQGTVVVSGNTVTYTPGATFFSGSDTFTYTITDSDPGTPDSATGTVTVNIADATPTVANRSGSGDQDTVITVTGGFTAGNGSVAQHTATIQTQATNGTCGTPTISGANITVVYTPNAAYTGADSCVVRLTDGEGDTGDGTYSFTVNAAGGGGGGSGVSLPAGSSSFDLWSLSLLAGLPLLRRRRTLSGDRGCK